MHESSLIWKQDAMGRVRVTAARRAEVVAEFQRSGLSGYRFARMAGVRYSTLMGWVQRATQEGPDPSEGTHRVKARPLKLVEAVVDRAVVKARPVVLELGGGVRMELTDRGQLVLAAQLIQTLQRPC